MKVLAFQAAAKAKKLRSGVEKVRKRLTHAERQEAYARKKEEKLERMSEEELKVWKAKEAEKRLKKRNPRFKVRVVYWRDVVSCSRFVVVCFRTTVAVCVDFCLRSDTEEEAHART